jgi:multidrug efflux pump subunit AcrA (membrane-fusion protein)
MHKVLRIILALSTAAALMAGTAGCTNKPAAGMNAVDVKIETAKKQAIKTTYEMAGVLVPAQTLNIASKMIGQVIEMDSKIGDFVKLEDVIIRLETKTLNSQLRQAEAGMQSAEATEQSVKNQEELAKINLDIAQKAYNDAKIIYDSGASSKSQLDDAANKLELVKKQYENAAGAARSQALASINTASANINNIRVQIENSVIKSPIDGVVVTKSINVGEIASPNVTLMTIADISTLKLKGTIPQELLPMLQVGQEIGVVVDIFPDKEVKGKIESIGPMAVSTGAVFPIEISIDNIGDIKAGLSAHAAIAITQDSGVVVPVGAITRNNGESYVFVVKDNVVLKRIVTEGIKNGKEVQILKGLDVGEQVAVTNVNSLFDNRSVNLN